MPWPSETPNSGLPGSVTVPTDLARRALHDRRGARVAIQADGIVRLGVVEHRIIIRIGFGGADRLQRFEIDDVDGGVAGGRDEDTSEVGGDRDAVDVGRVRDVAEEGASLGIHDDDVRAVGDEEAVAGRIELEIVPAPVAREGELLRDRVSRTLCFRGDAGAGDAHGCQDRRSRCHGDRVSHPAGTEMNGHTSPSQRLVRRVLR